MKQLITLAIFIIGCLNQITSQEQYNYEYGKVTQHEMSMTEYENDSEAEAVVIYEKGEIYFNAKDYERRFFLYQEKSAKIKILKAKGLDYATMEIPLYKDSGDKEYLEKIEGTVYNYDNGVLTKTILKKSNIFDEKINDDFTVKKIAFSDVREGSVIEYKYIVKSPFFFQTRSWNFQKKIPVIHSHLKYRAIPFFEYTYLLKGTNEFTKYSSSAKYDEITVSDIKYREIHFDFEIDSIAAFRDENFISSTKDYLISMDFQLSKVYNFKNDTKGKEIMSTWAQLCKGLLKDDNFGKYITNSEKEAKKILPTLDIESLSLLEKTKKITDYVKKMYSWDGNNNKYTNDKLSDFLKLKKGNTADINLFLVGMLKAADIEVNPIIFSTRNNGTVSLTHPFLKFFNYTIAEAIIDGQKYYIDATDPSLTFGQLSRDCANVKALVVKPKDEEEWITLTVSENSFVEKNIHITVDPKEDKTIVDAHYTTIGYDALPYKNVYIANKNEGLKKTLEKRNDIQINDTISNITQTIDSEKFEFSFNYDLPLEQTADKIFLKPFANLEVNSNPFTQKERTLPVDLIYLSRDKYISTIEIPEGYEVEYLPKNLNHNGRVIYLNYQTNVENNQITLIVEFFNKSNLYPANSYISLKSTFDILVKQLTDMVVLKKKK